MPATVLPAETTGCSCQKAGVTGIDALAVLTPVLGQRAASLYLWGGPRLAALVLVRAALRRAVRERA